MIVKNESKIILRLLESVYKIIDAFCICDTGSDDDTPDVIKNFFKKKNIPGYVSKKKFVNFGFNRNFSLDKCRMLYEDYDYILLLDADMIVKLSDDFIKSKNSFAR
jgi:glycosyltransferase involved in cell wall biosynthesis